ncbi:MAG: HAD family hydrolase [Alphaproteobacteria bacterium]
MAKNIAIFDLDRTLTRGGSFSPFLISIAREEPDKRLYIFAVMFQMLLYLLKRRTRKTLKEYMLGAFMTGMSRNQTNKYSKAFLKRLEDKGKFFESGLEAIKAHRKKGDLVVVATASMDFYVEDIAKKLGADHFIATTSVWQRGIIVPIIKGENCYGAEKAKRVQAYLAGQKTGKVWFYSDHHTDEPTFALVDFRVAVNPTTKLRRIAKTNGYDIQNWK